MESGCWWSSWSTGLIELTEKSSNLLLFYRRGNRGDAEVTEVVNQKTDFHFTFNSQAIRVNPSNPCHPCAITKMESEIWNLEFIWRFKVSLPKTIISWNNHSRKGNGLMLNA